MNFNANEKKSFQTFETVKKLQEFQIKTVSSIQIKTIYIS